MTSNSAPPATQIVEPEAAGGTLFRRTDFRRQAAEPRAAKAPPAKSPPRQRRIPPWLRVALR